MQKNKKPSYFMIGFYDNAMNFGLSLLELGCAVGCFLGINNGDVKTAGISGLGYIATKLWKRDCQVAADTERMEKIIAQMKDQKYEKPKFKSLTEAIAHENKYETS